MVARLASIADGTKRLQVRVLRWSVQYPSVGRSMLGILFCFSYAVQYYFFLISFARRTYRFIFILCVYIFREYRIPKLCPRFLNVFDLV